MSSKASYLSDPRCQCDFVVATTQASINSGLLEYLDETTQPVQYLCFLSDEKGYPTKQIKLEDLLKKSNGINPFYIPEGTDAGDEKVTALSNIDFAVGVMMQMGIPEGHTPHSLPPIVTLNTASNVTFNLFCKQVKVVSIKWGRRGAIWNVFNQPKGPSGHPWTMKMSVDLTIAALDAKLNTPYFTNNTDVRDQLLKALKNLSGTAFSLQQLFFDLDNAILETVPDFSSVDDEDARNILENYFRNMYVTAARDHGLPLVAVTAVAQPKDESTLHMTGFERIVNPLKDGGGNPISSPNESQREVATLDYLCAINNNPVPRIASLDWNWVQPEDINESSGAIAINRSILSKYIASNLKKLASSACYTTTIYPNHLEFSGNGTPVVVFPSNGSKVIHMGYKHSNQGPQTYETSETVNTQVDTAYTLDVFFEGTTIRVVQHSQIYFICTMDGYDGRSSSMTVVNKTLTDTYGISVDQTGGLQLVKTGEQLSDQSDSEPTIQSVGPVEGEGFEGLIRVCVNQVIGKIISQVLQDAEDDLDRSSASNLHEFQISKLQSFVFPGARVFTYKEPFFSNHQDLVCKITYLDPKEVSPTQTPQKPERRQKKPVTDEQTLAGSDSGNSPPPTLPLQNSAVGKLTASTDLMQNYVQGEIISPTNNFEALQTNDGHTLLFGCDTSGVFHVVEEQSGTSHTGWQIHDLSTTSIQIQFPGQESSTKVRTFDVGQSAVDGSIGLMMAVSLDGNDHLFMSLGNSRSDTSWVTAPTWTMVPFDPVNEQPQKITITGALFAETQDGTQYLVVDIDRPSGNMADPHITRYYIDPAREDGHYWVKQDVAVDISAGQYQSVVGRVSGKPVDGIYTAGHTGGAAQLVYEPVINWYGKGPATPITLQLPGGAIPSALATAHNAEGFSDLYAIGGSTLYRFAANRQDDGTKPTMLITSDLLVETDTLKAMTHDGVTTLWGRNGNDEVYYLSCQTTRLSDPGAWKPPIPILFGVERMSAYVNCADGGNTVFVAGNGELQKVMQDSAAMGGVWRPQNITIAAPPEQKSTSFKSYTTTIHVTQVDKDLPAPNTMVKLSAHSRTPVYINGFYYVLSPTPIQIATDTTGSLTIIDTTDSLHAAVLTASLDSTTTITINPMDKAVAKLTALDTAAKLRGAQFPSKTVAGGVVGSPEFTPLVDSSVIDDDVAAVAQHLGVLKEAYAIIQGPGKKISTASASMFKDQRSVHATTLRTTHPNATSFFSWSDIGDDIGGFIGDVDDWIGHLGDVIKSLPGDIWRWVKDKAEIVGKIFKDAASGTLHFFAKIGGKIYHAALDTVHALVGAMEWVYGKIKAGIKKLIAFVELLFQWDDIRRTKDVIHNAIKLWMQHQVDYIPKAKGDLDEHIGEFREKMNEWAGNADLSSLGNLGRKPVGHGAVNPNKDQTSGSKLLATHYQNHASQVQTVGDSPALSSVEKLVNDLLRAVSQEGIVLEGVFNQLTKLVSEFSSLTVEEILKRVAGILADAALSSVQVVVDALLTVLHDLAQSAIAILDTKIHIPIISDLLKNIVPELSFLDLICWIAAMGFTVVYKLIEQSPPFPKNDEHVQALISAGTWEDLEDAFGQSDLSLTPKLPLSIRKPFFKACHGIAGFLSLIGNPLSSAESASEAGSSGMLSKGASIIKVVMGGAQSIGDLLVPRYPVKNSAIKTVSKIASVLGVVSSIVLSGVAQSGFKAVGFSSLSVANPRGVGAIVGVILIMPRLVVSGWHFYELTKDDAGDTLSAAILGEVSNLTLYASRISYAVAVNDEDPDTRLIAVTAKAACDDVYSGLQTAESITGYS